MRKKDFIAKIIPVIKDFLKTNPKIRGIDVNITENFSFNKVRDPNSFNLYFTLTPNEKNVTNKFTLNIEGRSRR